MRLVLLDRDGTINVDRPDSVRHPDDLELIPKAASAIARLNQADIRVAIVTNQSVVGRHIISPRMLDEIHRCLRHLLAREGAQVDAIFECIDAPQEATHRRKPAPGMLREALDLFRATPSETPMIGDDLRDLQAAYAAGCKRVLLGTGKGLSVRKAGIPESLAPIIFKADLHDAIESFLAGEL